MHSCFLFFTSLALLHLYVELVYVDLVGAGQLSGLLLLAALCNSMPA
jgi:hypothetical protein